MSAAPQPESNRLSVQAFNFARSGQLSAALVFSLLLHLLLAVSIGSFTGIPGAIPGHAIIQKSAFKIVLRQPIGDASIVESDKALPTPSIDKLPQAQAEKPAQANTAPDSSLIDAEKSGLVFGPWYFTAKHLHRRPKPLRPINPVYPPDASSTSGKVLLRLYISEKGAVDKYEVVEESPPGLFRQSAIDAFASAQYAPGLITGYAVRSQLLLEVSYEPGLPPVMVIETPTNQ